MIKLGKEEIVLKIISYIIVCIFALICVIPFIIMLSGSLSSEESILKYGYSLLPRDFSPRAYQFILEQPKDILQAYGVTIFITLVGTFFALVFTSMAAYALSRNDFAWRNKFSFFIYFTTLFSGGLTPWYILCCNLGFKNNIIALIIPHLFVVFNILVFRNFIKSIPHEITESGLIDGANDVQIFFKLILPLTKPAMATIGLFTALTYWNEWYNTMLFISKKSMYSLQFYLYDMINNAEALKSITTSGANIDISKSIPSETVKLAMTIVATGPIVLVYPFVQKYFISGLIVGSVKG